MGMNLHLLRLFTAVVQQGSFSKAAASLYISQPAVSKAVQELERQVGAPLLDRSTTGIALTAAGQTLFRYAEQIFLTEQAAELELARLQGTLTGRLALGASPTLGVYCLPPLLAHYARRYPHIHLFLDIGTTNDIVARLLTSPLDLALVEGPVRDDRLDLTPLWKDRLVVIAPAQHTLARQQTVPLAEVLEQPFIGREPGSATRQFVEKQLHTRDISLPVRMEVANNEALKQLVQVGLGLGMVSETTIAAELASGRLVILPVPELVIERNFSLLQVVKRPLSASGQAFLTLLTEQDLQSPWRSSPQSEAADSTYVQAQD
jgi:DNA-binding transcriptional LysR family regulator